MKSKTLLLLGAMFLVLCSACQREIIPPALPIAAEIGARAPEIDLAQLENGRVGQPVKLSALRGKPIVLNFWATWCEPCKTEFPVLDEAFRKYRATNDLQVIAVNVQDTASPETIQQFLADTGVIFPVWLDTNGDANRAYNIQALPTTVFIDREGVIQQIRIGGPLTREYVVQQLNKIF